MSNSVDNRVVSMEFDNAKFERNVAQSLETLKHLDKSLDGLSNSSKKFDGVSFEDVANSIESLASRFTLGGRIIQKVFDDIAQGIVNIGHKIANFSLEGVTSGWDKYAEKTASVQTIMSATGQEIEYVEEQLGRLSRFTDETSYNFTDMTSNIAKFTSQGIELDTAVTQMQGIATWAASAGQNAQAASRAMYNISQAMGAGSMKLIDWKSIQNANMATKEFKEQAMQAAIAVGTLEEKEGEFYTTSKASKEGIAVDIKNFAETLKYEWFDTKTMETVFSEYGKFADTIDSMYESFGENLMVSELITLSEEMEKAGDITTETGQAFEKKLAKAADEAGVDVETLRKELQKLNSEELKFSKQTYKAAQEAKTFKDAIDATRDAVSSAWMKLYQAIFGNYENQRHLWTDMANWLYNIFAEPINGITQTIDTVMNGSGKVSQAAGKVKKSIQEILGSSGVKADQANGILEKVLKKSGLLTDEMISEAGSVDAAIAGITGSADGLKSTITEMLESNGKETKSATELLEEYRNVAKDIRDGKFGNGQERRDALAAAGFDPKTAQLFAELTHLGLATTEEDLWRLGETVSTLTDEEKEALTSILQSIEDGDGSIEELMDTMDKFENQYASWTGRELLFGREEGKRGAIYDIMDIIDSIGEAVSSAWSDIFQVDKVGLIRGFLENFKRFTQSIKDGIGDGTQLKRTFSGLFAVLDIGKMAVGAVFDGFKEIIGLFMPAELGIGEFAASIGDSLVNIRDWIKENKVFKFAMDRVVGVFKNLKTAAEPVASRIREMWKAFRENSGVSKVTTFFSNVFITVMKAASSVISSVTGAFNGLVEAIVEFYHAYLAKYVSKIAEMFSKLASGAISIGSIFASIKDAVVDFFTILFNFIKNRDYDQFVHDMTERFSGLATTLGGLGQVLLNGISALFNVDPKTALTIAKLSVALIGLIGILKIMKRLTSVGSAISNFFNTLSSGVKAFVRNYKVNTVLKIAISIGILVGALFALTKIPEDDLDRVQGIFFKIMWLFALLSAIASLGMIFGKSGSSLGFAASVMAFTLGIATAVGALWVLTTQVDFSHIDTALTVLLDVILMMGAAMIAISHLAGKASLSGTGMFAFAASILIIVHVLEKIQENGTKINSDAFAKLFGILLAIAVMSVALKGVRLSSALGLLVFVLSLGLIINTLENVIDKIPPADKVLNKLEDLLVIFGLLLSLAIVSRIAGGGGLKMAISLIAVIGAIYVLAKVAADIGQLPASQLIKGTAVVIALGLMVGAVIWLLQSSALIGGPKKGFATAVVALVAGIIALGLELVILSVIPWSNLLRAVLAIGVTLGALALVFLAVGQMSKNMKVSSVVAIFAMLLPLAAVFAALYALSKNTSPDTLTAAAEALGMTMLALAASLAIVGSIKADKGKTISVGKVLLQSIAILLPAILALYALKKVDTNGLIEKVTALGLVMLALAAATTILSFAGSKDWTSALTAMALMGSIVIAMLALVGILALLQKVPVDEGTLDRVKSISLLLLALGAIVLILSLMPPTANAATMFTGILGFLGLLTGLSILGGLIGLLTQLEGFSEIFTTGMQVLGEALGNFVGAFVGGLISSAIEALMGLKNLAGDLEEVATSLKGFDDTAIRGAKAAAGLILALGAADLMTGIGNLLGGPLAGLTGTDLGGQLKKFASAVVEYTNATKSLNENDINKVAKITEAMTGLLNALPKEGGLFDLFTGSKSQAMGNLKNNLGGENGFGAAIKSFVESVKDVQSSDLTAVSRVKSIVDKLGAMMEAIGKSGGLVQSVMGESNIAQFGIQILNFVRTLVGGSSPDGGAASEGILALANKVPDDVSSLDKIKTVTDKLVEATSSIPDLGGLMDKIFGSNDPSAFGEELAAYTEQLIDIGQKGAGITEEVLAGLTNVAIASAIVKGITDGSGSSGGDSSGLTKTMDALSGGLAKVGELGSKVNLTAAGDQVRGFASDLSSSGGNFLQGAGDLLAGAQTSEEAMDIISGFDTTGFDFTQFGSSNGAADAFAQLPAAASSGMSDAATAITTATPNVVAATDQATTAVQESITANGKPKIVSATADAASSAVTAVGGYIGRMQTAGYNFSLGYAKGILSGKYLAEDAARTVAAAALKALEDEQDSASPAKETIKDGGYFGDGYALGILSKLSTVKHAATTMTSIALDAVSMAAQMATAVIEDEGSPVIRPVVDLSEVRSGANAISNFTSGQIAGSIALEQNQNRIADMNRLSRDYTSDFRTLVALNRELLTTVRSGGNVYIDGNILAGTINSKLGAM